MQTRAPKSLLLPTKMGTSPMRSVLGLGVLLLATNGCGASSSGRDAHGNRCEELREVKPSLPALESGTFPTGELWVHARIPLREVSDRLAQEIPKQLAAEKDRPVGAPGNATFTVTRGTPKLVSAGEKLEVRVPIHADISVCKPIGSMCLKYGSCSPELLARFSVDPTLGENYELAPPQGKIAATKKCVIGLDVTDQLESIARKEVAQVEREIADKWPRLLPHIKRGFAELSRPIEVATDQCLEIAPSAVLYRTPTIEGKGKDAYLVAAVGLRGTLIPAPSCTAELSKKKRTSPEVVKSPPDTSELWFPEIVPFDEAKAGLIASIEGAKDENLSVQVLESVFSKERVALHLDVKGAACGRVWITAEPKIVEGTNALGLSNIELVAAPEKKPKPESGTRASLRALLEKSARIPLTGPPALGETTEGVLRLALKGVLPEGMNFTLTPPEIGAPEVSGTTDGLYVAYPIRAKVTVTEL